MVTKNKDNNSDSIDMLGAKECAELQCVFRTTIVAIVNSIRTGRTEHDTTQSEISMASELLFCGYTLFGSIIDLEEQECLDKARRAIEEFSAHAAESGGPTILVDTRHVQ